MEKRVAVAESAWPGFAFREFAAGEDFAAFQTERQTPRLFGAAVREEWRESSVFAFELGKRYLLKVSLRVDELREVHLGEARRVAWSLPTGQFKVEAQWQNYAVVTPLGLARGAALHARVLAAADCPQAELSATKAYQTVSAVTVVGPLDADRRLLLPLSEPERQVLQLHALGGSGGLQVGQLRRAGGQRERAGTRAGAGDRADAHHSLRPGQQGQQLRVDGRRCSPHALLRAGDAEGRVGGRAGAHATGRAEGG